jgi:hypothetical protein
MQSCFAREPMPAQSAGISLSRASDGAPIMPDAARALLVRLCGTKANDSLALAAARAMEQAYVRPHPFDFARLEDFVVRFAERLGPSAREWAAIVRPDKTEPGPQHLETEILTEETFGPGASQEAKLVFLRRMLKEQPKRARELMMEKFAGESASLRAGFIDAIAPFAGEDDFPLLKLAANDKAKSVREKAMSLLARVPGSEAYGSRLAGIADHLKVKTALVTRRKSLAVAGLGETPGSKLAALLEGVRLADLARILDLDVETFVAAAAESKDLGAIVLRLVIAERRFQLLESFTETLKDIGWTTGNLLNEALPSLPPSDREALIRLCVVPRAWKEIPPPFALDRLSVSLGGALPDPLGAELMASKAWHDLLQAEVKPSVAAQCDALAPLLPRSCSERFIAEAGTRAPRATLYHRLLLALPESPQSAST